MNRIVSLLVQVFVRWMPDAFVVAVLLTLLTFALATTVAGFPATAAVEAWGDGFWDLLLFTNQITLTLLLGYALANTTPVRRGLLRIAGLARGPWSAYALACGVTGVMALFSWGLSLVSAGLMARAVGEACHRRGIRVHYPLLVAASFSGFVIWHQGLTSSVGLAIATPGHFLEATIGVIPTSETIFTAWNLGVAAVVLLTLPVVMARLHPEDGQVIEIFPELIEGGDEETTPDPPATPAAHIEQSRVPAALIVLAGAVFVAIHFGSRGRGLELNVLNFMFLIVGLACAGSAQRYGQIIIAGGGVAAPFLLQYPFYAGIAGLMRESGLARMVVEFFASISTASTLPFFGLLSGGLLNIFIPSGGGQWAVQGPIMIGAAQQVGADIPRVAMAVALGDQWTNLIQPLVLMPVLGIAGISAREIMGYTFVALIFTGAIFGTALLL